MKLITCQSLTVGDERCADRTFLSSNFMSPRINSIDIIRGLIMVLMAIDHVRLYGGIPAGGDDPALFFTRWITHFCVSGFVFFAGTAIFLFAKKLNNRPALSRFLLLRGFLLIILELILIRFFWTFNLNLDEFILAGVIWMLGCCMVLMSLLVGQPVRVIGISGLIIVLFQQLFAYVPEIFPQSIRPDVAQIWNFFYPTAWEGFEKIAILYSIIPWIGVMALGYWFGTVMLFPKEKRDRNCFQIGGTATMLFLLMGIAFTLPASNAGETQPFIYRLLNQNKYPASQLFLLMTLGPLILLIPWADRSKSGLARVLLVFGRVPLFYYILHILLIHVFALIVNLIRDGNMHHDWYAYAPFYTQKDEATRWPLWLLYLVFLIVEFILYFICRWYMNYKQRNPDKLWLKYL